jgi:hypothetical protein
MRYAIGAHSVERETLNPIDGLYVYGSLGMPFVLTKKSDAAKARIPIFEDIADAQRFLSSLSKKYRKSFEREAKLIKTNRSEFRFFLVKVDSSKFNYVLSNGRRKNGQTTDRDYPSRVYYDLTPKSNMGGV